MIIKIGAKEQAIMELRMQMREAEWLKEEKKLELQKCRSEKNG